MTRDEIRLIADIVGKDKTYRHFVRRINKEFDLRDKETNSEVFVFFEEEKDQRIGFCVIGFSPAKMRVWEKIFVEEGWVDKDFSMGKTPFELMYMYVKPQFRKKGKGAKLFDKAVDFSKKSRIREIYAYVSGQDGDALSFYKRMNAEVIRDFSDEELSAAFLRWQLT